MLLDMSPDSFWPLIRIRIYLFPRPLSLRKEPMELGAIDTCGSRRVSAPSKVEIPCSWISCPESIRTGVAVLFSRWWCPEPVTTIGLRL